MTERERTLWTLGGTSGIGETAHERLRYSMKFHWAESFGIEDFNAASRGSLQHRLKSAKLNGRLPTDVLFSVGINRLDWIKDISMIDFVRVMETNVFSFLQMIRVMDEEGCGPLNIVAVTSDAAWRPMRTSAVYCASKAALEMAVRVASREYAPYGWRINAVAPGKVADTAMTEYVDSRVLELRGWTPEQAEAYELASTPLGRKVTKDEVADVIEQVMFGPAAQTGEIIAVNGGR